MNQKIDLFEEKIRAAMTQPAPGIEFKQELWETIQQSYQTDPERQPVMEKGFWRNTKPFRWGLAISFVLMLAAIFLSLTPAGRSIAQNVLELFRRSESDSYMVEMPAEDADRSDWKPPAEYSAQSVPTFDPEVLYQCGYKMWDACSMDKLRAPLKFKVMDFGWVPDGFRWFGGESRAESAQLLYAAEYNERVLFLTQAPADSADEFRIGSSAEVTPVRLDGVTGEYVRGSFEYTAEDPEAVWNAESNIQTLRWVREKTRFQLQNAGEELLDMDTLLQIAARLTEEEVDHPAPFQSWQLPMTAAAEMRAIYPILKPDLQEQASFPVVFPQKLPSQFLFFGAKAEDNGNVVSLFYSFAPGGSESVTSNGLVVSQVNAEGDDDAGFQVPETLGTGQDEKNVVPSFDSVSIADGNGQYVVGTWSFGEEGAVWGPDDYIKRLRWRIGNRAFELLSMGTPLSQEDLVWIAEDLTAQLAE